MTDLPTTWSTVVDRRRALALIGAAGVAVVTAACSGGGSDGSSGAASSNGTGSTASSNRASSSASTSSAGTTTRVDCVLTPEMTEGPYYLDDQVLRRDVTEGRPGVPLRLELTVADASSCAPVSDRVVEIWHADAAGAYSGFGSGGSDTTFLRGGQTSDANGAVVFDTIYPGWYRGRAVHIHLKVHDGNTVHTTQLFFDQDLTDEVFTRSPYAGNSGGTTNAQDNIYSGGGTTTTLKITPDGDGYVGTLVLGMQR
jgi:protocatechuate 3,4-dioxygenase beta subunit